MRNNRMTGISFGIRGKTAFGACCVLVAIGTLAQAGDRRPRVNRLIPRDYFEGKELFEKSWEPGQPSPFGGDGLGPLYNETSCVGCHNLGGTGGGGGHDRSVQILTAVEGSTSFCAGGAVFQGDLVKLHPGFQDRASIVLHKYATTAEASARLKKIESISAVQTGEETKVLRSTSRNTPALFGAGLLDAIPDSVLRGAEKRTFVNFPEIKGRVSELPDGRLGRFGWKAQISSLDNFVRAACSNELGLEVPGQHQASLEPTGEFDPSQLKLDMDEDQCKLLTSFIGRLNPPVQRAPSDRTLPPWGYLVFESIGCATCHTPKLGAVNGLFSDLLLHDMGEASSDSATYSGSPSTTRRSENLADAREQARRSGMATPTEWRTPPLWGVADSTPYLHDGRAHSLDAAIRSHGGESAPTMTRYTRLAATDRRAVLTFLSSLSVSPEVRKPAARSGKGVARESNKS
jgi:CxxC motif-containing protein (DUF1111 family)